jgi:hypothetical protein
LGGAARAFRDWVGIPAAVATLVTALFYPAMGTVLGWFHQDRASLSAQLFNTDIINVGDDEPISLRPYSENSKANSRNQ